MVLPFCLQVAADGITQGSVSGASIVKVAIGAVEAVPVA